MFALLLVGVTSTDFGLVGVVSTEFFICLSCTALPIVESNTVNTKPCQVICLVVKNSIVASVITSAPNIAAN